MSAIEQVHSAQPTPTSTPPDSPRKFLQFELNTGAISDLANEYVKPEKLTPVLEEHKSGIIVAALWLTLCLRSWLSYLPFPSFTLITTSTLLPFLLILILTSLSSATAQTDDNTATTSAGGVTTTIKGLSKHFYQTLTSFPSLQTLTSQIPLLVLVILLFPPSRALSLLYLSAVFSLTKSYFANISEITSQVSTSLDRVASVTTSAREHIVAARTLEMHALLMVSCGMDLDDLDDNEREKVKVAKEVKCEVESLVRDAGVLLDKKVDKALKVAERTKGAVREDGDVEFAREMICNLDKLVERAVVAEGEIAGRVMKVREKLWMVGLGEGSA